MEEMQLNERKMVIANDVQKLNRDNPVKSAILNQVDATVNVKNRGATGDVSNVIQVENSLSNLKEIRNFLKGKGEATTNHIEEQRRGTVLKPAIATAAHRALVDVTGRKLVSQNVGATGDVAKCYSSRKFT
ncbi:hypothetical protein HAX54_052095 [Datura stramonium]|uniref:Uncharacterized protein n=1 Tax=Datura stramonium TaxID=4076 RepID=A0ABS8T0B0_DATST|nr:hypothetical protein [Datura stramonium]